MHVLELHESEKVIAASAASGTGVFSILSVSFPDPYGGKGAMLHDGAFFYPVGRFASHQIALPDPGGKGVLGRMLHLEKMPACIGRITPKLFMMHTIPAKDVPEDKPVTIIPVDSEDTLREFAMMRSDFLMEEVGTTPGYEAVMNSLSGHYRNLLPVLIVHDGAVAGMVSSNFHADGYAMVNMLFIKKEYRGKGLSRKLMLGYEDMLSETARSICLFYSPGNLRAEALYNSLGYDVIDEWGMVSL